MIIKGGLPAHGAKAASRGDHRIAMSLAVTALAANGETEISGCESADISFPGFFKLIPYSKCTF
jgi:3-phosphoshikimate 1-carboxyvinyltransferase